MTRTVEACPECDSASFQATKEDPVRGVTAAAETYYCTDCGHRFDEPAERKAKTNSHGLSGTSQALADMDSDAPFTDAKCRECGVPLGAGYLCDDCDTVEVLDD